MPSNWKKTPITCSHQNPKKCKSSTLKRVLITGATITRVSRGRKFQRTASQRQILPYFAYKTCPTEPLSPLVCVLSHVGYFAFDCPTCACPTIPNRCNPDSGSMMGWLILRATPLSSLLDAEALSFFLQILHTSIVWGITSSECQIE